MPPVTHRSLLVAAQRALSSSQLDWLRQGHHARHAADFHEQVARLLSAEGRAHLDEARQQRSYSALEIPLVARQLAYLAAQASLLGMREANAQLMAASIPLGHTQELPKQLITQLSRDSADEAPGEPRDRALAAALEPMALRWVEARGRAASRFVEQLEAPLSVPESAPEARGHLAESNVREARALESRAGSTSALAAPEGAGTAAVPSEAAHWLDATDDAARELTRWLTRSAVKRGNVTWPVLFSALRATQYDGLARPARRLYRLAEGTRRLGFERELTKRVRAESSVTLFAPSACVVPLSVPDDIRVVQPSIEFGVLSDLVATQSTGEALALALVSPADSELTRLPCAAGVSAAIGGLFQQLRAEPRYLTRMDELSPDVSERLARHAAIFVLLRTRLDAALWLAEQPRVRSDRERLEHLTQAAERALGCVVPPGIAALAFFASPLEGRAFEASACSLALHAALRERFDDDWYANPRVNEVLRGACARGNLLSVRELCAELAASPQLGIARALEILD